MSIREKRGYNCVDEYNPSIDLWATTTNPQGIKIKKKYTYIICTMYLSEFNFLFAFLRWMKDVEKEISSERQLPIDCASGKK